ncbi:hypothetical protein GGR51DRAFT_569213 [Nemania sp. FL0031]|nr:hypothetical protein GGR51DRAFT_569213 [Nemania sp. FL0031]
MDIQSLLQNDNTSYQDLRSSGSRPQDDKHKQRGDTEEYNRVIRKRQKVVESRNNISSGGCESMPTTSVATAQQLPRLAIDQLELQGLWAAGAEIPQTKFIEDLCRMRPVRQLTPSGKVRLNLRRTQNLAAALIQITGRRMDIPCEGCRRYGGIFVGCVIPSVEMHHERTCANHYYNYHAKLCSFNLSTNTLSCDNDSSAAFLTHTISQLSNICTKDGLKLVPRRKELTDGAKRTVAGGDELLALIQRELIAMTHLAGNETVHSSPGVYVAGQTWDIARLSTLVGSTSDMSRAISKLVEALLELRRACHKTKQAAQTLRDDLAANDTKKHE